MVSGRAGSLCPSLRLVQRKQENAGLGIRLVEEERVRKSGSLVGEQAAYLPVLSENILVKNSDKFASFSVFSIKNMLSKCKKKKNRRGSI